VLLYGLSGNPIHMGHHCIVKYFRDLMEAGEFVFHQVWVLPVAEHPFAERKSLVSFEHRMAMCKGALASLGDRVCVKDAEMVVVKELLKYHSFPDDRVGTYRTMAYFKLKFRHIEFHLALGADAWNDLNAKKWADSDLFLSKVPIQIVCRPGVNVSPPRAPHPYAEDGEEEEEREDEEKEVEHCQPKEEVRPKRMLVPACSFWWKYGHSVSNGGKHAIIGTPDVSSTTIRLSTDMHFLRDNLHPYVLQYIVEHKLFARIAASVESAESAETGVHV
jgi:nicotinate (nicotinamide) nucleotide adenylyltransferase